jgi:hypothetical protein
VTGQNIAPKSIARDMHEQVLSFNDYIKEYGLARAEGVLLRYLTDVYRALRQTVPDKYKTEDVLDLEEWLGAEVRQVDASLLDEWERLEAVRTTGAPIEGVLDAPAPAPDITQNQRAFVILVRNACFRLVRAMASRDVARFVQILTELAPDGLDGPRDVGGEVWTPARIEQLLARYWEEHEVLLVDGDARSASRLDIDRGDADNWRARQVLSDPEAHHDWALVLRIHLAESRVANRLVLSFVDLDNT